MDKPEERRKMTLLHLVVKTVESPLSHTPLASSRVLNQRFNRSNLWVVVCKNLLRSRTYLSRRRRTMPAALGKITSPAAWEEDHAGPLSTASDSSIKSRRTTSEEEWWYRTTVFDNIRRSRNTVTDATLLSPRFSLVDASI